MPAPLQTSAVSSYWKSNGRPVPPKGELLSLLVELVGIAAVAAVVVVVVVSGAAKLSVVVVMAVD